MDIVYASSSSQAPAQLCPGAAAGLMEMGWVNLEGTCGCLGGWGEHRFSCHLRMGQLLPAHEGQITAKLQTNAAEIKVRLGGEEDDSASKRSHPSSIYTFFAFLSILPDIPAGHHTIKSRRSSHRPSLSKVAGG